MLALGMTSAAAAQDGASASTDTDASTGTDTSASPGTDADANTGTDASTDTDATEAADANTADEEAADTTDEEGAEADVIVPTAQWSEERVIGWATLTASMAVGIAGGILLAAGVDDVNSIENAPDGTMWSAVEGARDRAPILTGIGAVMLGLGAAGVAVGAGLLAYFGNQGTWISVSVLPNGVSASGRF